VLVGGRRRESACAGFLRLGGQVVEDLDLERLVVLDEEGAALANGTSLRTNG
jgi:hypothetical protein